MAQTSEQRREKHRAASRRYYAENRERILARQREYYAENRDEILASQKPLKAERNRKSYVRYRDKRLAHSRVMHFRANHGLWPEQMAALWEMQDGLCYLCGRELTKGNRTHVDHDHAGCPAGHAAGQSCQVCRRGLACGNCNASIGMVGDDPGRLRRMADALEAAQQAVEKRKASYEQVPLF